VTELAVPKSVAVPEVGVTAVEEPPTVTEKMRVMVMPEMPEPVLVKAVGGEAVPVGVSESGCGRRTRQCKQ
jgi:hypothetical protein